MHCLQVFNQAHAASAVGRALGGLMLLTVIIVLFAIFLIGGVFGHSRYGYVGWSPAALVLLAMVVLYLTGHLTGNVRLR